MAFADRLNDLLKRHEELSGLLANPDKLGSDFAKLSKEYSDLGPIDEKIKDVSYKHLTLPTKRIV